MCQIQLLADQIIAKSLTDQETCLFDKITLLKNPKAKITAVRRVKSPTGAGFLLANEDGAFVFVRVSLGTTALHHDAYDLSQFRASVRNHKENIFLFRLSLLWLISL